jgi:hypothetical protein
MPTFRRDLGTGLAVFNNYNELIMNDGRPIVQSYLTVAEIQEFLQTLEKAYDEEPNYVQRNGLQRIICTLQAQLHMHQRQHEELVSSSPTGQDLEDYLFSYANAMANGAIK